MVENPQDSGPGTLQEQLRRLDALRQRGALTDDEHRAQRAPLIERAIEAPADPPPQQHNPSKKAAPNHVLNYVIVAALVVFGAIGLLGLLSSQLSAVTAMLSPGAACSSDTTESTLKSLIYTTTFDIDADAKELNTPDVEEKIAPFATKYPLAIDQVRFEGSDTQTKKVRCAARLTLSSEADASSAPATQVLSAILGGASNTFQISYSVQPVVGSTDVYVQIADVRPITQRLAALSVASALTADDKSTPSSSTQPAPSAPRPSADSQTPPNPPPPVQGGDTSQAAPTQAVGDDQPATTSQGQQSNEP